MSLPDKNNVPVELWRSKPDQTSVMAIVGDAQIVAKVLV